jgi:hypothetical protein
LLLAQTNARFPAIPRSILTSLNGCLCCKTVNIQGETPPVPSRIFTRELTAKGHN